MTTGRPRKKGQLDPKTRERLDRILQRRPRPLTIPDPSDHRLRRWIVPLTAEAVHAEILRRLAERWHVVHDALASWPHAYLGNRKARFPSLIQFLERITIDDPVVQSGGIQLPLIALRTLGVLRRDPSDPRVVYAESPPDSIDLTRAAFEERFFREWVFRLSPYEGKSIAEYEELRSALKDAKKKSPLRRREVLRSLLAQGPTVQLLEKSYPVPDNWRNHLSVTAPPSEVARLLLSKQWGCDPQAAKELLVGLKKEAPIRLGWTAYERALGQDSARLNDIRTLICRQPPLLAWPHVWPDTGATSHS